MIPVHQGRVHQGAARPAGGGQEQPWGRPLAKATPRTPEGGGAWRSLSLVWPVRCVRVGGRWSVGGTYLVYTLSTMNTRTRVH
eukprot:COSAG02_NODE_2108_length_9809_cov_4.022966_2_plen_83_part_00